MNFQYITLKQRPHVWIPQNVVKLTMLHLFNYHWSVVDQFSILSTCTESLLQSQEISVDPKRVLFASLASAAKTQQRWLLLRCSCSYLNNQEAQCSWKLFFHPGRPFLPEPQPSIQDLSSQFASATEPRLRAGWLLEQVLSETGSSGTVITNETETASREISHLL